MSAAVCSSPHNSTEVTSRMVRKSLLFKGRSFLQSCGLGQVLCHLKGPPSQSNYRRKDEDKETVSRKEEIGVLRMRSVSGMITRILHAFPARKTKAGHRNEDRLRGSENDAELIGNREERFLSDDRLSHRRPHCGKVHVKKFFGARPSCVAGEIHQQNRDLFRVVECRNDGCRGRAMHRKRNDLLCGGRLLRIHERRRNKHKKCQRQYSQRTSHCSHQFVNVNVTTRVLNGISPTSAPAANT